MIFTLTRPYHQPCFLDRSPEDGCALHGSDTGKQSFWPTDQMQNISLIKQIASHLDSYMLFLYTAFIQQIQFLSSLYYI